MNQGEKENKAKKEAMKQLRAARKEQITMASDIIKQQKKDIAAIKEQIQNNVGTVPLIADATGIPASNVLWYIAALKKYGDIIEGEKDGSYFQYVLPQNEEKREDAHDNG
jgi:hypothetical protein